MIIVFIQFTLSGTETGSGSGTGTGTETGTETATVVGCTTLLGFSSAL